ncbi:hypothetical protein diail_1493, partial [Diaporthe ilicicola]
LVDWTLDSNSDPKVTKVASGDFDIALKLSHERPLRAPHAVGNVLWRSPEGQSGKGIAKPSDVYSFGRVPKTLVDNPFLQWIHGIGGGPMLIPDDDTIEPLIVSGVPVEQEVLVRHFLYFGPLPDGLLRHVGDETWDTFFRAASEIAESEAVDDPNDRFPRWPEDIAPHLSSEAKDIISRMTNLDPAKRVTIEEVLEHPCGK